MKKIPDSVEMDNMGAKTKHRLPPGGGLHCKPLTFSPSGYQTRDKRELKYSLTDSIMSVVGHFLYHFAFYNLIKGVETSWLTAQPCHFVTDSNLLTAFSVVHLHVRYWENVSPTCTGSISDGGMTKPQLVNFSVLIWVQVNIETDRFEGYFNMRLFNKNNLMEKNISLGDVEKVCVTRTTHTKKVRSVMIICLHTHAT